MSTNSTIAKRNADGSITSVYGHWDGYPSHIGNLLLTKYNTEADADAILALGDFSSLGPKLVPEGAHSYEAPEDDVSVFYGRDRDEEGCAATTHYTADEFLKSRMEYTYIWIDSGWKLLRDDSTTMHPLTMNLED